MEAYQLKSIAKNHSSHKPTYFKSRKYSSEQQSSCSQCKRDAFSICQQQDEQQASMQPSQPHNIETTSSSQDQAETQLRKNINYNNQRFEQMLKILQYQIEQLKKQNEQKNQTIKNLRFSIHNSGIQSKRKSERKKENLSIGNPANSPRNYLKKKNQIEQKSQNYPPVSYTGTLNSYNKHLSQQHLKKQTKYKFPSDFVEETVSQSNSGHESKITALKQQIKSYKQQLLQQKQAVADLEFQTKWQKKFITSFIKMCEQLSKSYGDKLKMGKLGNDMKKKTKMSWNFMKNLISFFIQTNPGGLSVNENKL